MWRPANTTSGSAGTGAGGLTGPEYSPRSTCASPRSPAARSRPAVSSANTNACWRTRRHSDCTNDPTRPAAPRYSRQYSSLHSSNQSTTTRKRPSGRTSAAASSEKYGNEHVWTTS